MIRLDKLLANRGYCSRRQIVAFIKEGHVQVNGRLPLSADEKVNPEHVVVMGQKIDPPVGLVFMLHKPAGYSCSREEKGKLVYELLPERYLKRNPPISSVGRLDKETTGLLLFTDDGEFLHRLTSPKHQIKKIYEVEVANPFRGDEEKLFGSGKMILKDDPHPLLPVGIEIIGQQRALLTLSEGRYHQIRRMFVAIENCVMRLHRKQIGDLTLKDLPEGKYRLLTEEEMESVSSWPKSVGQAVRSMPLAKALTEQRPPPKRKPFC